MAAAGWPPLASPLPGGWRLGSVVEVVGVLVVVDEVVVAGRGRGRVVLVGSLLLGAVAPVEAHWSLDQLLQVVAGAAERRP